MVELNESDNEVKEVRQGELAHVPCQFLQHPVEVDLNTFTESVIAHGD